MPHLTVHSLRRYALSAIAVLLFSAAALAQAAPQSSASLANSPLTADFKKYPGLAPALDQLGQQLQTLQFPAPRTNDAMLPLLPSSTNFFAALPNYGDTVRQAVDIFERQLQQSPALRDWWTHGETAKSGPKLEAALQRFAELSGYLGDEVVISAAIDSKDPQFLIMAQVQKSGLKQALQQFVQQMQVSAGSIQPIHILEPQELATLQVSAKPQPLLVLVRPDFVVATSNLATLRTFNAQLDKRGAAFSSTLFGQRIAKAYDGGADTVGAADLHDIIRQLIPPDAKSQSMLKSSGLSDVKYLVWNHTRNGNQSLSESELSFTGPRRGIASWIAAPTQLGSLDFVSPTALMCVSMNLKSPAQIFEDIEQFSGTTGPNNCALCLQAQAMGIDIENDVLRQLSGEITIELDSVQNLEQPEWKLIFRVVDAQRLQQTLTRLMTAANVPAQQYTDGGVTYHVIQTPSPKGAKEVAYAFVSGYVIFTSSREALQQAVRAHQTGESLAHSSKFLASLPSGHPTGESLLMYQDPTAIAKLQLQQMPPEIVQSFTALNAQAAPTVVTAYAAPESIRAVSTSAAANSTAVMIAAAILMPNLMRGKMAANEATALDNLRKVNSAQHSYESAYPDRGFAPDLAALGPDPSGAIKSADHANFVEAALGAPTCTGTNWCELSGYRFSMKAVCGLGRCNNYVIAATPADSTSGSRSFCSASDGTIHFTVGSPLKTSPNLRECRMWPVVK